LPFNILDLAILSWSKCCSSLHSILSVLQISIQTLFGYSGLNTHMIYVKLLNIEYTVFFSVRPLVVWCQIKKQVPKSKQIKWIKPYKKQNPFTKDKALRLYPIKHCGFTQKALRLYPKTLRKPGLKFRLP